MNLIENNNAFLMAAGNGSRIEIHTVDAEKDSWAQISTTVDAGADQLTFSEQTSWEIGDRIAIAATGFDMNEAEERTITDVSPDGLTITLDAPLDHAHLGEIRTYDNGLTGDDFRSWEVDMRAEVALLSRNVTIQGDADSAEDGYGGHIMVMNDMDPELPGAAMHIDGAEFTLMGQEGIVGRYPLHWHMLGDASGQYITNTSVHHTFNKGMTIHGTQNTWVENVAIYDTIGHTYYFEDGSEYGNVVMNTLGMNTREVENLEDAAIGSDHTEVSTYWVTNPDNHLIDNHAAGSDDTGFWILSQNTVQGSSLASGLYDGYVPRAQTPGQWTGNLSHSNRDDGLWIGSEFDETDGSKSAEPPLLEPFQLLDYTTYSNGGWGIWQRNGHGDYEQIRIIESNAGAQMWGSSRVEDSLFVGRATNGADPLDQYVGWQLYDNPTSFSGVHFEGYTGETDAAIANGWGFGRSTVHSVDGLTFAQDGSAENSFLTTQTNNGGNASDQGGPIAGGVIDLDGSLTGTAGAIITPGLIDFRPDTHVDVLTYADDTIAASGFNWSQGAEWRAENLAWVHDPGTVIGKMTVVQQTRDAEGNLQDVSDPYHVDRVVYTVERSDNGAKLEINENAMVDYAWHMQYNLDTSDGVEYIFDYSAQTPDAIKFELTELPDGETAFYRFKGLPDGVVFQKADAAADMAAFDAATVTTWIREDSGDYLVKAVAEIVDYRDPMRSDDDIATARVFTDDFTLVVQPLETDLPSGNDPWQRDLDTYVPAAPTALPDRANSTSDTVEITQDHARWSDAASWDGDLPGIDDIVIIGPDQTVVLDTFVKVGAILVYGGALLVEDTKDLQLAADWIFVTEGGLFQVGTEETAFVHDFELTLEGDDRNNVVDVMALMNATGEGVVRALTNDNGPNDPGTGPETTQSVIADQTDTRGWDYIKTTRDADGNQIAYEVVYDDGRGSTTTYADGVRTERRDIDAEDVKSWDMLIARFDAQGNRTENIQRYDDGRTAQTQYTDGVRSAQTITDEGGAKPWDRIETTYSETGQATQTMQFYDDGRLLTTGYENGLRVSTRVEDQGNAKSWSAIEKIYDESGALAEVSLTYDDGRVAQTRYADGVRSETVLTDGGNAKNWDTITTTYSQTGQTEQVVTAYDDGQIETATFVQGIRTTVQIDFPADQSDVQSQITRFAANGATLETTRTMQSGEVETTTYVSPLRAINLDGGSFTAANGLVYEADPFGTNNGFGTGAAIAGTENDALYQSQRWNNDTLSYAVAVENGSYLLELNFAETFSGSQEPGARVFDIFVEDELVFNDFDIADQAGFETAIDLLGTVNVADGELNIDMVGVAGNPSIGGFSIWTADGSGQDDFVIGAVSDAFAFV